MKKDDTIYLRHMLDAIAKMEKYINGIDYEGFIEDTQIQDSIIRQLEITGEATKRLRLPLGINIPIFHGKRLPV